ncbi:hypothetical protein C5167_037253 [Papaver somniferum]|uniref:H15 domain-containing protein n=1 Tax=Papaver somniferum TaxID=3469 RepID=A0A4Y7I9B4_PAPSO|nr:histone H1-like [Papaver somniferum]RZC44312.1 hypothetical protein C5167_037253 [Papaver somniferum]
MSQKVEKAAAVAEKKSVKEKKVKVPKEKKEKVSKEKKPKSDKAPHPTYFQMIKEALLALNEKGGSSPYAIAKYMEEKHKDVLPSNYKKMLGVQLKNCVANQKLIKIKASFKLSDASKKEIKAKAVVPKPKSEKSVAAADDKTKKRKKPTTSLSKSVKSATAVVPKSKTTTVKKSETTAAPKKKKTAAPAKKVTAVPAKKIVPGKKTKRATAPVKAKHPKSIKSPAAKRAKKSTAA